MAGRDREYWLMQGITADERRELGQYRSLSGAAGTYHATHQRLMRERGPAWRLECAHCDAQAAHWAYDHEDRDFLLSEDGKTYGSPYSLDLDHYLPLCAACHKRFDARHGKYWL